MHNFFIKNNFFSEDKAIITGEDVNHIKNVLRMNIGTKIYTTNHDTHVKYLSEIVSINSDMIECKLLEEIPSTELPINITLFQGLPKADKLEYIIEKSTELGVNTIIPVEMRFSIAKIKNEDQKNIRWNKIAESAAKQSKRNIIPKVELTIDVKELANRIKEFDLVVVAYENENKDSLKKVLETINKQELNNIAIIVGPEGGIDNSELEVFISNGAKCVTLGKRILRTETAPLAILSMLIYEFEL